MSVSRILLSFFGLLLACVLAVSIYCYLNFAELVKNQARRQLLEYGVQDVDFAQLKVRHDSLSANRLWLRGQYQGLEFEADLDGFRVNYHWRNLLLGKLQSLDVTRLDVSLHQTARDTADKAAPLRIDSLAELLPGNFLAALPLDTAKIEQWQVNYQGAATAPLQASGKLQLANVLDLQLRTTYLGSEVLADIYADDSDSPLALQLALRAQGNDIAELSAQLGRSADQAWRWQVQAQLQHESALAWLRRLEQEQNIALGLVTMDELTVRGNTALSGRIEHPDQLDFSAQAKAPLLSLLGIEVDAQTHIERLDYPAAVSELAGDLDLALKLEKGQWQLVAQPTELGGNILSQQLSLPEETRQWLQWGEQLPVLLRTLEQFQLHSNPDGSWSANANNAVLLVGNKDSQLRWEKLQLQLSLLEGERLLLNTQLGGSIKTRLRHKQLPQLDLAFSADGTVQEAQFNLALNDTAESFSVDLQGQANMETGQGDYLLKLSSQDLPYASSSILPLLQKFRLLQQEVEISAGSLTLDSAIHSESFALQGLRQRSSLLLRNLSGRYQEYAFEGVSLKGQWSGVENWQTSQPIEFTMARFNAGFEVEELRAQVSLPRATPIAAPVVRIDQFSASMFGGRVYLPQARAWDFGAADNALTLRADNWQLAQMVALQQNQDIQALGQLEGELPLRTAEGRIIIENGYLRALPPGGIIRYVANEASRALAANSPELGLALDLLSDFQYEVLSSEVELDKAGNLLLGLSLAGRNPAQYEGRLVNFNINLEQNLDPLLQSLRLSDNLVKKLEDGLQ